MIITRQEALQLCADGKASIEKGTTMDDVKFDIVDRYDIQRTDHCMADAPNNQNP